MQKIYTTQSVDKRQKSLSDRQGVFLTLSYKCFTIRKELKTKTMEKISTNDPLPKGSIWAKIIKPYEDQLYAEEYIKLKLTIWSILTKKKMVLF